MKKSFLLVLVVLLVASACGSSDKEGTTTTTRKKTFVHGTAEFSKCGIAQCATIKVPMDYENPDGRKINIAINKIPARNQAERIGVILVNPGGPGQSGTYFVKTSAASVFSEEVLDKFDIIGWDTRGSGSSSKVNCTKDMDPLFDGIDYSPDTEEEFKEMVYVNEQLGKQCEKADEELMQYITTKQSAHDMDAIRIALEEEQINYLGYSYGTALGQVYAAEFPANFRTMVMDGVVNLLEEPEDVAIEQALGFEDTMDSFFAYCERVRCTYSGTRSPRSVYSEIVAQIDGTPMDSRRVGFQLGSSQLDLGTSYYLYSGEAGWATLNRGLVGILNGDPSVLLDGFSQYVGRDAAGTFDGSYLSFLTINCSDGNLGDVEDMREIADSIKNDAPIFGESGIYLGMACATWPNAQLAKALDVEFNNVAPIMIIGTTGDPATPVQWARDVADEIDNSVYIEKVGEGHTIYGRGDACIDNIVNTYFLTAEKPAKQKC